MKKLLLNYLTVLLIISVVQNTFAQSNEIIIGLETDSIFIYDFEDIHLKDENNYQKDVWFDIDSNGINDIGFWVVKSVSDHRITSGTVLKAVDSTFFSYEYVPNIKGYCDSLYEDDYQMAIVKSYSYNSIFSRENDSIVFQDNKVDITYLRKLFSPCRVLYNLPYWLNKDEYIGFKKHWNNNVYLGWFKIEILDYDEIIIKEYAINKESFSYTLFINEVMASNKKGIKDEYGEHEDWIEIFNGSNEKVWLGNLYLSDIYENPGKWQMPDTIIEPGDFLVIWADNQPEQGILHANFKLDKDGAHLGLFSNNKVKLDELEYEEQTSDISIGRQSDGVDNWIFFESPTPGASNQITAIPEVSVNNIIKAYPNPAKGSMVFLSEICNYKIYNIVGQLMIEKKASKLIDTSKFERGLYFVAIDNGQAIKLVIQ